MSGNRTGVKQTTVKEYVEIAKKGLVSRWELRPRRRYLMFVGRNRVVYYLTNTPEHRQFDSFSPKDQQTIIDMIDDWQFSLTRPTLVAIKDLTWEQFISAMKWRILERNDVIEMKRELLRIPDATTFIYADHLSERFDKYSKKTQLMITQSLNRWLSCGQEFLFVATAERK
jgi:hypothetical protein